MTATTIASEIAAATQPWVTSATSTARLPVTSAPTMGMNAPMKTNDASGNAKGTCRIARPTPIPIASTAATTTVART